MAINETVFRGKKVITIDGKVDGFYVNPIKPEHIKTYSGKNGPWTPTHRYNLIVDGQPISLGMGDKDGVSDRQLIQAKDNDGKYHTLAKGLEVSVEVTENGEYQGKKQYQSSNSKVVVLDASGAEAPQQKSQGGAGSYQAKPKFDQTGVSTGQSVNGALNFLITWGVEASNENIVKYGKLVHTVTEKVKEYVKTVNPEASEYEQGARGGLAVLTACKLVGTEQDFASGVEAIAKDLVDNVFPPIMSFVKGEEKPSATPTKVTRASPAKKVATKATPVVEHDSETEDESEDLPF